MLILGLENAFLVLKGLRPRVGGYFSKTASIDSGFEFGNPLRDHLADFINRDRAPFISVLDAAIDCRQCCDIHIDFVLKHRCSCIPSAYCLSL